MGARIIKAIMTIGISAIAIAAPAHRKNIPNWAKHANGARNGRRLGHDQYIVVFDMSQLMRHDAGDFFAGQHVQADPLLLQQRHVSGLRPVAKALG